jgi:hypothetical protein
MKDLHEYQLFVIDGGRDTSPMHRSKFKDQAAADRAQMMKYVDGKDVFKFQIVRGRKRMARRVPVWTQSEKCRSEFLKSVYPVLALGRTSKDVKLAIAKLPKRKREIAQRQLTRAALADVVVRHFYLLGHPQSKVAAEIRRRFDLGRKKQLEIVRNVLKRARGYASINDCKDRVYQSMAA